MTTASPFFSTLHDGPMLGSIGRGTHYSILRAVNFSPAPRFHDFAVIWDEDHDLRVLWVIEQLFVQGALGQALAIGERKGNITVLTIEPPTQKYREAVERIATGVPTDSFSSCVEAFGSATSMIIHDEPGRVRSYLGGIHALWMLGSKDVEFSTKPFEGAPSSPK